MAPHPPPPADLASRRIPITRIKRSWYRVYNTAYPPLFFGKTAANRFDAPDHSYGVLYLGFDPRCAFIETFGHDTGIRLLDSARLAQRGIARVTTTRPLRLVDLRAEGLARLGAEEGSCAGHDYALAQSWSRALHDHPRTPDGLIYRARHDPSRYSVALFARASSVVRARRIGRSLIDKKNEVLLGDLLDTYHFGLLP